MGERRGFAQEVLDLIFRERVSSFSLSFCAIRLLAVVGTRGKAALRIEAYAWVPVLWVFDKLLEVGFSPYLSFYSHINVLLMFRLNEAVRGRLIGPKTWDRIDRIFESKMEKPVTAPRPFRGCLGVVCLTCALNGCLVRIGPGMAMKSGFTK